MCHGAGPCDSWRSILEASVAYKSGFGFDVSGTACDMGLDPVTHGEYFGSIFK